MPVDGILVTLLAAMVISQIAAIFPARRAARSKYWKPSTMSRNCMVLKKGMNDENTNLAYSRYPGDKPVNCLRRPYEPFHRKDTPTGGGIDSPKKTA